MPQPIANPSTPAPSIDSLLKQELDGLGKEIDEMVAAGLSSEDAETLLSWAKELESKVQKVAAMLRNPSPATVSDYLRFVASRVERTKDRKFATSSLLLVKAILSEMS